MVKLMNKLSLMVHCLVFLLALTNVNTEKYECSIVQHGARLDCHPERGANEAGCVNRGCCWGPVVPKSPGEPMCFFPKDYTSYEVISFKQTERGFAANLSKAKNYYMNNEFKNAHVEGIQETTTRFRVRFTDQSNPNRWEPLIPLGQPDKVNPQNPAYKVEIDRSPFGLKIMRSGNKSEPLLDSTGGMSASLILSDQFLQISFQVFAQRGFGPGEVRSNFPHLMNSWSRTGLWARDVPPSDNLNLYGVHNMFMGLSSDGSAFGIFLLNSNAQEFVITPLPAITYRSIGGILDFFIFTGPKPADVIAQYYELIGRPMLPPYWALGFHLSRYGYKNLNEVQSTLQRNLEIGIPIAAQWIDIDYMDRYKVWTVDQQMFGELGKFMSMIKREYSIKSVLILDPAISTTGGKDYTPYTEGLKMGIFINDSRTGAPIKGTVWPGETVFPDFSHPNAEAWWFNEAKSFYRQVPFDGLWVDMNEPANFDQGSRSGCDDENALDNPPYIPTILDGNLYSKTICPSALHYKRTPHYHLHNMYGYDHARVTRKVLQNLMPHKRPFVLSRSTFAGSGRFTIHWTGDNLADWSDMKKSIGQLINFNLFGMPMIGADICGFRGNSSEELCVRWSQLGAYYPFARNHNELGARAQDPGAWSSKAIKAIRMALLVRKLIQPYFYTLMYRAHLNGSSVIRSLAFEYPEDQNTHDVSEQFMVGSCLLINPVLYKGATSTKSYIPAGEWINLSSGSRIISKGEMQTLTAPISFIPVLMRAGCVLPAQLNKEKTIENRKTWFGLHAILSVVDDGTDSAGRKADACGELFWDDGESNKPDYLHVSFVVKNRRLVINSTPTGQTKISDVNASLQNIMITGISKSPKIVEVNGNVAKFYYVEKMQSIALSYTLDITSTIIIQWMF